MNAKQIPKALILLRLLLGFIIICLSIIRINHYSAIAITLLIVGLLSDIFDGIIARRLNVSTQNLRRLDSSVDQVFFIAVVTATYIQCPHFFKTHSTQLLVLLILEGTTYIVSLLKFKKEIATHSLGAKVWSLLVVATLIQVISECESGALFQIMFWIGVVTRLEIIAIVLILRKWTNDVPTFYHALQLRQNKEIKRHKIFNG